MNWTEIAFKPDPETTREASEAWEWLVGEPWHVLMSSMFGGLFLEKQSGGVFRLECGAGLIERVADNTETFDHFISGERDTAWWKRVNEWFLPAFVERLHEVGKRPGPDQCYGLTILPIFEGGRYVVENVFITPRREWLSYTGSLYRQMKDLPDGAKVQIVVDR